MSWIMGDIEADGPIPGEYSMVSFGAVVVESGFARTFYGELRPISEKFLARLTPIAMGNIDPGRGQRLSTSSRLAMSKTCFDG